MNKYTIRYHTLQCQALSAQVLLQVCFLINQCGTTRVNTVPVATVLENVGKFPFSSRFFSNISHREIQVGNFWNMKVSVRIGKFSIFPDEKNGERNFPH